MIPSVIFSTSFINLLSLFGSCVLQLERLAGTAPRTQAEQRGRSPSTGYAVVVLGER